MQAEQGYSINTRNSEDREQVERFLQSKDSRKALYTALAYADEHLSPYTLNARYVPDYENDDTESVIVSIVTSVPRATIKKHNAKIFDLLLDNDASLFFSVVGAKQ
jgi:hypothetical protein